MRIVWSPLAVERAAEIVHYIAKDHPTAASHWVDMVFHKVEALLKFPERGRRVPESKRKDIREIMYGNYRIIYRVESNRISILTIRHGKQLLPSQEIEK